MTPEQSIELMIEILSVWESGIDNQAAWEMLDLSEQLEQKLIASGVITANGKDNGGLAHIVNVVIEQLVYANHQHLLPEDIPHIRGLLVNREVSQLEKFNRYLNSIDHNQRKLHADSYWYGR